ncbi:LAME_0H04478g1_1 [Lachancea meyersii CBS 8951]|uniref:Pre-mRNA-splicing factor 18 n=1 Tax=Lachancea meyersii CBS 8951 TaxID=1266667 RepID=A0A1G4KE03_9SACH|nr:LAME_0H04478g1_1 [Lachancea meyersii CBS 8951]
MDLSSLLKVEIARKKAELRKPEVEAPESRKDSTTVEVVQPADELQKGPGDSLVAVAKEDVAERNATVHETGSSRNEMDVERLRTRPERVARAREHDEHADTAIVAATIGDPEHAADLALQCNLYVHQLLGEWQDLGYKPELVVETKKALFPLLVQLRKQQLPAEFVTSVATILYHVQHAQFAQATQSYLKLSIGNVAWPIGVTSVGIHARSAQERIQGRDKIANVMLDEPTRLWITSVKRLVSFAAAAANMRRKKSQLQDE